ncbi:galactan 5-O-arabinofuranosyltransferase [Salinifilum aidingensis]
MTETVPRPATVDPSSREQPHRSSSTRPRVLNTVLELGAGSVLAVVVSMLLQFAIAHLGFSEPGYAPEELTVTGVAAALGVLALLAVYGYRRRPRWLLLGGTWTALSAFTTVALATPLQSTRYFFGGSGGDNAFRMQYMTRMAETLGLADMNYADAAPYYPAGWFWLGGRFANLLGWPGWAAYKPYSIVWIAVAAVVAFTLWGLLVNRRLALLAASATTLIGMATGGFVWTPIGVGEPYAWPSAAWLPPIAVLTWRALGHASRPSYWTLVGIGAYLGFAAATYTLYFGFAVLLTVTMAVVLAVLRVRGGERAVPVARDQFLRLVPIGAVSLAIALLVWVPYLLATDFLLNAPSSAAPRYLASGSAYLPVPMTEAGAFGAICLAGLAWLVLRCRRHDTAAALLCVAIAVYGWFGLSTLALFADTSLLAFRMHPVFELVLATAGIFGAAELLGHLRRTNAVRNSALSLTAFAAVLGLLGAISLEHEALKGNLAGGLQLAYEDHYPSGVNAQGASDPTTDGAHNDELIAAIDELSGRQPEDNIVLTTHFEPLVFRPYWGFQHKTPHYASPVAHYDQRNDVITRWSHAQDSRQLLTMLDRSDFAAPNVFVLRNPSAQGDANIDPATKERATPRTSDDFTMTIREDAFPRMPGHYEYQVHFDPAVFHSPEFSHRQAGPFTVIARR